MPHRRKSAVSVVALALATMSPSYTQPAPTMNIDPSWVRARPLTVAAVNELDLRRGQFAVSRTQEPVKMTSIETGLLLELPYRLVGTNAAGKKLDLVLDVEVGGGGLRFDPAKDAFIGKLFLGLRDKLDPSVSSPIGKTVSILVTAVADTVTPEQVTRTTTNQLRNVQILARRPGESVAVRIRPEFDQEGVELSIPVQREQLSMTVSPGSIQGFGLETADVTIRAPGGVQGNPISVQLRSVGARPNPSSVILSSSNPAKVLVRSRGVGVAELTAESDILMPATVTVDFEPPWGFGIAAALGGLVGGLIRFLMPLLGNTKKPRPRELALQTVLGILAGILTVAAYSVGINFLDVAPTAVVGEALVFTIAALGALSSGALFARQSPALSG